MGETPTGRAAIVCECFALVPERLCHSVRQAFAASVHEAPHMLRSFGADSASQNAALARLAHEADCDETRQMMRDGRFRQCEGVLHLAHAAADDTSLHQHVEDLQPMRVPKLGQAPRSIGKDKGIHSAASSQDGSRQTTRTRSCHIAGRAGRPTAEKIELVSTKTDVLQQVIAHAVQAIDEDITARIFDQLLQQLQREDPHCHEPPYCFIILE